MEHGLITQEIIMKENKKFEASHSALKEDEEFWRLKYCEFSLQEGNINSKVFHNWAQNWTLKNKIKEITMRGNKINDFGLIQDEEIYHFHKFYSVMDLTNADLKEIMLDNVLEIIS